MLQIAKRFLADAGFTCQVVTDGHKCVATVMSSQPFDLILMDCQVQCCC